MRQAAAALVATIGALTLAACGGASHADCTTTVTNTLSRVALRIYHETAAGRNDSAAVKRVERATSLVDAVARGDARAAQAALAPLIQRQIVRIDVSSGGRVIASYGNKPALAPVHGVLRDASGRTVGTFVLSVQGDLGLIGTIGGLTGSPVLLRRGTQQLVGGLDPGPATVPDRGPVVYRGTTYRAFSFPAEAYPSGMLRVSMLTPPSAFAACNDGLAQTRANTIGAVGMRIYHGERQSGVVTHVLAAVEHSPAFIRSVARGDAAGARAAILGFFRAHLHVVRVRAMRGSRLLIDLGGPYALAPVRGSLRDGRGRVVGNFQLAVQDDLGYVILAHRFTGAQVVMRNAAGPVPVGTLNPPPTSVPDRGTLDYGGRTYRAFSFTAEAFPSGPLRISLLVPA